MKREAPEDDEDAKQTEQNGSAKRARSEPADDDEDDDLDAPVGGGGHKGGGVKKGHECPYLDTISRQVRPECHRELSSTTATLQWSCVICQSLLCVLWASCCCLAICDKRRTWTSTLRSAVPSRSAQSTFTPASCAASTSR